MSVNYTDFDKIWASTSPLTPYEFSESQYKEGWNFVGNTPPSRQMWDKFMQQADEKMQYLYNHESVPVGHEYFTFNPNIPQGSLPLFGGEYSRETYSALWNWVQEQTGYLKTEAEWQTLATANNGNVPFYSDGDGSTTFRVPSLKCWVKGANGTVSEVGSYLAAGLPNITGTLKGLTIGTYGGAGAFTYTNPGSIAGTGNYYAGSLNSFNASLSNSIYGNSTTVQPPSIVGMWLVKAYGVVEDTGQIDEQQYIDDRIATRLPLTGGTMLGALTLSDGGTAISDKVATAEISNAPLGSDKIQFWKCGRMCMVYIRYVNNVPAGAFSVTENIPDGFKPLADSYNLFTQTASRQILFQFHTDGTITGYNYGTAITTSSSIYQTFTYITSS